MQFDLFCLVILEVKRSDMYNVQRFIYNIFTCTVGLDQVIVKVKMSDIYKMPHSSLMVGGKALSFLPTYKKSCISYLGWLYI